MVVIHKQVCLQTFERGWMEVKFILTGKDDGPSKKRGLKLLKQLIQLVILQRKLGQMKPYYYFVWRGKIRHWISYHIWDCHFHNIHALQLLLNKANDIHYSFMLTAKLEWVVYLEATYMFNTLVVIFPEQGMVNL